MASYFDDVPPGKAFRTCNGVVIRNLSELKCYLDGCSEYDFRYHVNADHSKNDFAIWVREVVGDEPLAHDLDVLLDLTRYRRAVAIRVEQGSSGT